MYSLILSSPDGTLRFETPGRSVHHVYHILLGVPTEDETLRDLLRSKLEEITITGLGAEETEYLYGYIDQRLGKKNIEYENKLKLEVYKV